MIRTRVRTVEPKVRGRSTAVGVFAVLAVFASIASGCGSSSTSVLGPSGSRCAITLSGGSSLAAGGGTGSVSVATARECTWTASSDAAWLTITAGASGQGDGTVQYSAANNPAPSVRRANVVVGEARTELTQAAAPCQFGVTPPSFTFEASGGDGSVTVQTLEGCRWTAASGVPWIAITGTQNPNGSGSVAFHIDANAGEPRTSTIIVAGQSIQVSQGAASAPCSYVLEPAAATVESAGGTARFNVAARAGCGWMAVSQVPWIDVAGNTTGAGNGTITLVVSANTGPARAGTVSIQGQTFTVNQAAAAVPCTYGIAPTNFSASAAGGPTTVNVTTQGGCTWTAASLASWIVVSAGSTGSGNGTVTLLVAANTGAARSGTALIAGQTFTVNQAAAPVACTYTIAPTTFAAPASAATSTVDVTTQSGCAWTAVSQAPWITVTTGATGTGNGRVELAIAANTGGARSGTVTIAGHTYTVNQAAVPGPCSYTIAPTNFAAPDAEVTTAVDVTAGAGCAWTAVSQAPWITVTAGAAGSGNGRVALTIAGNTGAARTGTVTIAGQTYTVNQGAAPAPCSYTIAPTTFNAAAAGGTSAVDVTTQTACGWTAASQVPWITVTAGASGTGNGHVELAIAANTGAARTGTVLIGNQTYTVIQDAPPAACTFTLTPTTQAVPVAGGDFTVTVGTQPSCAWTAASSADWLTFRGQESGTGNGAVGYRVAPNVLSLSSRTATITLGGQVLTVTQDGLISGTEP